MRYGPNGTLLFDDGEDDIRTEFEACVTVYTRAVQDAEMQRKSVQDHLDVLSGRVKSLLKTVMLMAVDQGLLIPDSDGDVPLVGFWGGDSVYGRCVPGVQPKHHVNVDDMRRQD